METTGDIKRRTHILLYLSLGFCLAAGESKQYTALWRFETKPVNLLLLISATILIVGVLLYFFFRNPDRSIKRYSVIIGTLAVLQAIGTTGQFLDAFGSDGFLAQYEVYSFLTETSFIALLLEACLFSSLGLKESVQGFIFGFALAGTLQVLSALLRPEAAGVLTIFFAPLSVGFLILAGVSIRSSGSTKLGEEKARKEKTEDSAGEGSFFGSKKTSSLLPVIALSFFFMGALLISTHAIRMSYQDQSITSYSIQIASGLSSIIAAFILWSLNKRFASQITIKLCCLLILPVLLSALYLSSLFTGLSILFPVLFLHRVGYAFVYYLLWTMPLTEISKTSVPRLYVYFFCALKFGWAAGIYLFMILPANGAVELSSIISVIMIVVFGLVSVLIFLKTYADKTAVPVVDSSLNTLFSDACSVVGASYGLTPRENEVLPLLARGRTAAYIKESLVISDGTVRAHMDHIYKKLSVNSQQELIGLVEKAAQQITTENK